MAQATPPNEGHSPRGHCVSLEQRLLQLTTTGAGPVTPSQVYEDSSPEVGVRQTAMRSGLAIYLASQQPIHDNASQHSGYTDINALEEWITAASNPPTQVVQQLQDNVTQESGYTDIVAFEAWVTGALHPPTQEIDTSQDCTFLSLPQLTPYQARTTPLAGNLQQMGFHRTVGHQQLHTTGCSNQTNNHFPNNLQYMPQWGRGGRLLGTPYNRGRGTIRPIRTRFPHPPSQPLMRTVGPRPPPSPTTVLPTRLFPRCQNGGASSVQGEQHRHTTSPCVRCTFCGLSTAMHICHQCGAASGGGVP